MSGTVTHLSQHDWATKPGRWHGRITGQDLNGPVSILFFSSATPGAGPVLHTHPYDEIFICHAGRARFTLGDQVRDAVAGDVLRAPAGMPHKFEVIGPERYEGIDIHCSPEVIQTDLE
ncbi:cupin domain-containing protein [Sedimentitalea sp. HM32M-2]|uniref:cupin domain-containing protein n=1 Tax=Sedimentitalea sp. HM32M-2 TaxID=3351566 RepID=UPI0036378359